MYHFVLTTTSGETAALSGHKANEIESVAQALKGAIVARG
jgi:hypothetical protein